MNRAPFPDFDGTQLCQQVDPEEFFPDGTPAGIVKRLCLDCHFRVPCRAYALDFDVYGIWGATSRGERQRIRRQLGITPVPMYQTLHHTIERGSEQDEYRDTDDFVGAGAGVDA